MSVDTIDETFAAPAGRARLGRTAAALRENGYLVHLVDTVAETRELVTSLLPKDQAVFTTSSETLRQSGIAADIDESGEFESVRRNAGEPGDDVYAVIRLGATAEVVVGSVHAVTEQGHLVVASATGSQFSAYASGARKAIWVVLEREALPERGTVVLVRETIGF